MYYGLTNFYQNHRRYVKSRDDNQLLGKDVTKEVSKDCEPFAKDKVTGESYAPCGAIANSMFNGNTYLFYVLFLTCQYVGKAKLKTDQVISFHFACSF